MMPVTFKSQLVGPTWTWYASCSQHYKTCGQLQHYKTCAVFRESRETALIHGMMQSCAASVQGVVYASGRPDMASSALWRARTSAIIQPTPAAPLSPSIGST